MPAYAGLTCQVLLLAVFAFAAGSKVTRRGFAEFVASTGRLLPARWSRRRRPAAAGVLIGELVAAALLVWPGTAPVGFAVVLALSLGFATGVGAALRRGERAPCRCFGSSAAPLGRTHLVRNGVLAATALAGVALAALSPAVPAHPAGVGLAVLVGLLLAVLVVRMDDLVGLFAPMSTSI